jgi:hypothetical protein
MANRIFTFPSRLQVELKGRSITGMKETVNQMSTSLVDAHTKALQDATVKMIDPGPYDQSKIADSNGRIQWLNALSEDRLYGLIATRLVTYPEGNLYNMQIACLRCPNKTPHQANLLNEPDGDLLVYEMPEESYELFKSQQPFEVSVEGQKVLWRQLTGKDEKLIEKLARQDPNADTDDLAMGLRIIEIEGVHANDKMDWIKGLGAERLELQDDMSEQTCGVDTVIDVVCQHCKSRFEAPLPFDADFWVPLQKFRDRRRQRLKKARRENLN